MANFDLNTVKGPHAGTKVSVQGNTKDPKRALLLFHGRHSSAENILMLAERISLPNDVLVCAPDAEGGAWYPNRFRLPRAENEPHLSSAHEVVGSLIEYCKDAFGIAPKDIILAGFSQGSCLISDYVARNPQKYGGVCIFSGGLIGTEEDIQAYIWKGDLKKTSIYMGCDEADPHIPKERVDITAGILKKLGANVTVKIYSGLGHNVNPEEIGYLQKSF